MLPNALDGGVRPTFPRLTMPRRLKYDAGFPPPQKTSVSFLGIFSNSLKF